MRIRPIIALLVVGVWAPLVWWVQGDRASEQGEVRAVNRVLEAADDVWKREDVFIANGELSRVRSILMEPQLGWSTSTNPDRVRILAVGDSYGEGYGLVDLDARWVTRLETLLTEDLGATGIEVVTLARGGASTFTYTSWLEALRDGDYTPFRGADTSVLDEPFDVLIVGHHITDQIAGPGDVVRGGEETITPIPQWSAITDGSAENPHWEEYLELPGRIVAATPAISTRIWLPLEYFPYQHRYGEIAAAFRSEGFTIADTPHTDSVVAAYDRSKMMVYPVDHHPNAVLHNAFAHDARDAVLDGVPAARIEAARRGGGARGGVLLSNYFPEVLQVSSDATSATVRIDGSIVGRCGERVQWHGGGLVCGRDGTPTYRIDGVDVATSRALCAFLGRPYVQVMLDPTLPDGSIIETYVTGPGAAAVAIHPFGYDEHWFPSVQPGVVPRAGRADTFTTSNAVRGFLIANDTGVGCDLNDSVGAVVPDVEVAFTRVSG